MSEGLTDALRTLGALVLAFLGYLQMRRDLARIRRRRSGVKETGNTHFGKPDRWVERVRVALAVRVASIALLVTIAVIIFAAGALGAPDLVLRSLLVVAIIVVAALIVSSAAQGVFEGMDDIANKNEHGSRR